jgi:hypothetical protein
VVSRQRFEAMQHHSPPFPEAPSCPRPTPGKSSVAGEETNQTPGLEIVGGIRLAAASLGLRREYLASIDSSKTWGKLGSDASLGVCELISRIGD